MLLLKKIHLSGVELSIITILFLSYSPFLSFGQKDVPGSILDTLYFNNKAIVIYKNYTWDYLYAVKADTGFYTKYWDNNELFPYMIKKASKPTENRTITLIKENEQFIFPVKTNTLYGGYKRSHPAWDIKLNMGDTVRAAFDGKVRYSLYNRGGYGNLVIIRHNNGLETYYAHLSDIMVYPNKEVKAGDLLGFGGSTGRSRGPHLHFEIRYMDKTIDPAKLIDFDNKRLKTNTLLVSDFMEDIPITDSISQKTVINRYYTVKKGDTLYSIAKKNHTSVGSICKLNNITKTTVLSLKKKIRVN